MSQTDGRFTQDLPCNDLQIFRGPSDFVDISGGAVRAITGTAYSFTLASTIAATFRADLMGFHRTGMFGNSAYDQNQFGTSLAQPGPLASIPNSGDPDSLSPGFPPLLASQMATLGAIKRGPTPKGMFISSFDVIYSVSTVALSLAQVGIKRNLFVNGVAPVSSDTLVLGTNGLATAAATNPYVINVPLASNTFDVTSDSVGTMSVNLTAGSGGTAVFYGVMYHLTYNWN
jgi:hypothetical protein